MQSWADPLPQLGTSTTVQVRLFTPQLRLPGADAIAAFTALVAAVARSVTDAEDGATAAARAPSAALCDTACRKLSM
jgi:hypothetical protein